MGNSGFGMSILSLSADPRHPCARAVIGAEHDRRGRRNRGV